MSRTKVNTTKVLLLLPNQMFDIKYFKQNKINNKTHKVVLYEHPQYFTKYNFNKKKLILHYASMKYYKDYLEKNKYNVNLIKFSEKFNLKDYEMFKSADKLNLKPTIEYDNPNYLLNTELHEKYQKKTKSFMFNNFYMWSKNELDILKGVKSTEKMNRERMPKDIKIPKLKELHKTDKDYIIDVVKDVDKDFSKNYGNTDNFIYPVTHKSARLFLRNFMKYKFKKF